MGNIIGRFRSFEKELPSVQGKVFVITGTTSGTGYTAALTVAKHGGEVILLNRASPRSKSSLEKLREAVPDAKFVPVDCDLQDFQSVKAAVNEIKYKLGYAEIFCLCNNAGIMAVDDKITKTDGFEVQMQTNHLSHFLLTQQLFPLLKAGAGKYGDARIVNHSSIARFMTENSGLEEKYLKEQEKDGQLGGNKEGPGMMKGGPWFRYQQTKLANSVFTHALADKLNSSSDKDCKNILSICAHPGVSRTNLGDHLHGKSNFFVRYILGPLLTTLVFQSQEDGSMGILKCMMDPKSNLTPGTLYGPKVKLLPVTADGKTPQPKMDFTGYPVANSVAEKLENDPKDKDMLWALSEKATGVTFNIA